MENNSVNASISPVQMVERASDLAFAKSKMKLIPTLLLAFLAGMYIAFGGIFSLVVATGTGNVWPFGVTRLLQGIAFSLGLILVVVGGAELFTGNMLMSIAWAQKKISTGSVLKNWLIVYIGNFLGSIFLAGMILLSKTYQLSQGEFGNVLFKVASTKMHYGFLQALSLGVLCNILVCLAVWLSYSAKTTTDKILAVIFPISTFIAAGFEHSVANMFLIPAALLIKALDPFFAAGLSLDLSAITWPNFLFSNLLPVTIGNMLGGIIVVGLIYYFSYKKDENKL
jgi:formate transporter